METRHAISFKLVVPSLGFFGTLKFDAIDMMHCKDILEKVRITVYVMY